MHKSLCYSIISNLKRDSDTFDVTMGAHDGAEICELVEIFMLSLLSKKCSSNNKGYIVMADCQFLQTLMDNKQKTTGEYFKKFSKTKACKYS